MSSPDPVRAARALNGAAAAVLLLEGITVLFVPRAIAQSGPGLTGVRLVLLLVLAALLVAGSGVQRRPWGLVAGTVLQVPLVLTGLMSPVMWFLGGIFLVIWLYLLQVRRELLGTPFGAHRVSVSPLLPEALESAIELAEAGPDDALGGSGVLVTGSVVTAGEARTLLRGNTP